MDNKHINKFDDDGLIPVGLHKFYIGHKLIYEKTYLNGLVDGFIKFYHTDHSALTKCLGYNNNIMEGETIELLY